MTCTQLELGERLRDEGIAKVSDSNKRFLLYMRTYAQGVSAIYGEVDIDSLREHAARENLEPASSQAWGGVFRGRGWKWVARRKSTWPSNHGRKIDVWRWEG